MAAFFGVEVRLGFASGLPNVPPTVVFSGFGWTAPIMMTSRPTGERKMPNSCSMVNTSLPVRTIGEAMSASPATMIPTPTRTIERFIGTEAASTRRRSSNSRVPPLKPVAARRSPLPFYA